MELNPPRRPRPPRPSLQPSLAAGLPPEVWVVIILLCTAGMFTGIPVLQSVGDALGLVGDTPIGLLALMLVLELGCFAVACFGLAWLLSKGDPVARILAIVVGGSLAFGLLLGDGFGDRDATVTILCSAAAVACLTVPPRAREFFVTSRRAGAAPTPIVAAEAVVVALSALMVGVGVGYLRAVSVKTLYGLAGLAMIGISVACFKSRRRLSTADPTARALLSGLMAGYVVAILVGAEGSLTGPLFVPLGVAMAVVVLLWVPQESQAYFGGGPALAGMTFPRPGRPSSPPPPPPDSLPPPPPPAPPSTSGQSGWPPGEFPAQHSASPAPDSRRSAPAPSRPARTPRVRTPWSAPVESPLPPASAPPPPPPPPPSSSPSPAHESRWSAPESQWSAPESQWSAPESEAMPESEAVPAPSAAPSPPPPPPRPLPAQPPPAPARQPDATPPQWLLDPPPPGFWPAARRRADARRYEVVEVVPGPPDELQVAPDLGTRFDTVSWFPVLEGREQARGAYLVSMVMFDDAPGATAFRGTSTLLVTSARLVGVCARGESPAGPLDPSAGRVAVWRVLLDQVDWVQAEGSAEGGHLLLKGSEADAPWALLTKPRVAAGEAFQPARLADLAELINRSKRSTA